jgi:hydrogenase nickel incorporation protein HypA/HybF
VKIIRKIYLEVGEYSGIVPKLAQDFFGYISKGTIAEDAIIDIKNVPTIIKCKICGNEGNINPGKLSFVCPKCGMDKMEILSSGREWRIESLEVE